MFYHDGNGIKLWTGTKVPTKVSELTNDSGYITSADVPEGASAYTGTISAVSTTASNGTNNGFARGDHVHNITGSTITSVLGYTPYDNANPNGYTSNVGTITGVTAGTGLSGGGTSGAVTVNHSNSVTAKTTQALYPIKYDSQGHITGSGNAVTSLPASDVSSWAKASSKPSYNFSEIGNKPTTISGYGITDAYTKTQVDGLVSGVLHYKGTKATVGALPTSGNTTGDVWHVTADGSEHAWDGESWQELGTAVDLSNYPTKSDNTASATTGILIADHTTDSICGVQSSTTSVIGVQSTTTAASKVTLGTAISVPNVTSVGSASTWEFEDITVPIRSDSVTTVPLEAASATTVPIKNPSATSIPNVTAVGSGSASLTMTMDTTDTKKLNIAFSHTHTPPTLGTDISIIGVQSNTTSVRGVSGSTTVYGVEAASTVTASHVKSGGNGTVPTLGTVISIPNVTEVLDVTVPIKNASATTVPIKNTSATVVVTNKSHSITDNGHVHSLNS